MQHADHIAGLPSQPQKGVAARLLRRFGGVVRGAIAGIVRLRHPAATPTAARPATKRPPSRAPQTPHPAPSPLRRGWIAGWFGRRSAAAPHAWPFGRGALFTPEHFPGMAPEACGLLNTPAEDCDPDELWLLLIALTGQIAREAGMDLDQAEELFVTLWQRLGPPPGEPADKASAEPPDAAPSGSGAAPDGPPAGTQPAPQVVACPGQARPDPSDALPSFDAGPRRAVERAVNARSLRRDRRRTRPRRGTRVTVPRYPRYAAGTGPPSCRTHPHSTLPARDRNTAGPAVRIRPSRI